MKKSIKNSDDPSFAEYINTIRSCRVCHDQPRFGQAMGPEPRPIIQVSQTASICIASQAPGTRVYETGRPFNDASGVRLRQWMSISDEEFYDDSRVAIIPMGFCFPGLRADGSDLPPRRECKEIWRTQLFARLPNLKLLLTIGGYAQRWHLGPQVARQGVTETVRSWRQYYLADPSLRIYPLPHPSWHNNRWLKQNIWFEDEVLPQMQQDIRDLIAQ